AGASAKPTLPLSASIRKHGRRRSRQAISPGSRSDGKHDPMTLYAIGDIQGCAAPLDTLLAALDFDPARDRLWLVGDLVNRGPDSLAALRRVIALGDAVPTVLGNHDLHLLAAAAGIRRPSPRDTLRPVLEARDRDALLDWLRRRPLLHHDDAANRVLVHAGIPPAWTVADAKRAAREVEAALAGPDWQDALGEMYGNEPSRWSPRLRRAERLRYTINALTRMRFCTRSEEHTSELQSREKI